MDTTNNLPGMRQEYSNAFRFHNIHDLRTAIEEQECTYMTMIAIYLHL